eukprot:892187-Pyramimonas_sp.AAC.1
MLRALLALMQAASARKAEPALVVVTRGAAAAPASGRAHPVHASMQAVVGMARVIPAERSKAAGMSLVVDLCPDECDAPRDVAALLAELAHLDRPSSTGESAWRARARYSPALELLPLPPQPTAPALHADATYVMTGATGGLGMRWTRYLLERGGAKCLVLTSRRAPKAEVREQLAAWEAQFGARLVVMQGDVAEEADTARILAKAKAELPPVRGIFHLAGAVDDGTMDKLTWPRFHATLAAKVDGSLYLHEQAGKLALPLDHF